MNAHSEKTNDMGEKRGEPSRSPRMVIWEVTRFHDLACACCPPIGIPVHERGELSTAEGTRLIEAVRKFDRSRLVLTGSDPLKRSDIFDLIAASAEAGLRPHLRPRCSPLLAHDALLQARRSGLEGVSIALDGSGDEVHDRFRGVGGAFQWSLEGAASSVVLGLRLAIHTTLTRHNIEDLPAISDLVGSLEAAGWTLVLPVAAERATAGSSITAQEYERVFEWLHRLAGSTSFHIETREGPHYRRVAMQGLASTTGADSGDLFIDSRGRIQPGEGLPLTAGDLQSDSLITVYRQHEVFLALRDPDRLRGRCGRCEFRAVCGGSRARAYASTGDYLAEDPACVYDPPPPAGGSEVVS
jgi:radical SAM protein with 4Fe4S-binding SPASM domain